LWRHSTHSNSVGVLRQVSIVSHSYQTYFSFLGSDFNLDSGLHDHVITRFSSDIPIYSKGLDEHVGHLRKVLEVLRKESLYANLQKSDFCMDKIIFLDYVVSAKGIKIDEAKVKVI